MTDASIYQQQSWLCYMSWWDIRGHDDAMHDVVAIYNDGGKRVLSGFGLESTVSLDLGLDSKIMMEVSKPWVCCTSW